MRSRTATAGLVLLALFGMVGPAPAGQQSAVVARVYGAEIRLGDISPPQTQIAGAKKGMKPSAFDAWLEKIRQDRLDGLIWTKVTERAAGGGLQPTKDEIQGFISFMEKKAAGQLREFQNQRKDLRKKLSRRGVRPAERKRLESHLKTMDQLIAHEKAERKRNKTVPDYDKMKRRSLKRIARITIRSWKMNKALYEKYGGRVIFQQMGYEPVGAYGAMIAEAERARAVKILDPSFPPPFARMKKYLKMGHNYVPKEAGDDYFATPWWLKGG